MAFDLGDVVPLAVDVTDENGTPADAGAVALTVVQPDGTSVTPAVTHPSLGRYEVDFTTTQAGRHTVRWVATGVNASAYTDMFDVAAAAPRMLVSLVEAKRKCKIPLDVTEHDDSLRGYIEAATEVVEDHLHEVVVQRELVEYVDADWQHDIALPHTPVVSVTSAQTADGVVTWSPSDMILDGTTGIVRLLPSVRPFHGLVRFVYVAGRSAIPANYHKAGLIIIEHLWETERPMARNAPPMAGGGYQDSMSTGVYGNRGFAVPNRAIELLGKPPVQGG